MHGPKNLLFYAFSSESNPLHTTSTNQGKYLRCYLLGLKAKVVIEEQSYFDRDYLSEFSAFYSLSARGYPNICRRLHFFSSKKVNRGSLLRALSGDKTAMNSLSSNYLGFIVVRPIQVAPFGRTVLKWFPDGGAPNRRVVTPSRDYTATLCGLTLRVNGLAWQQQDSGVSACATIGLWTMLHSSAFDAHHAIPTTAQITEAAHATASLGARVFPSKGLRVEQILEAIKAQKLAPVTIAGDMMVDDPGYGGKIQCFSKAKLASSCAAFIRSGYPVLIIGRYLDGVQSSKHMVCAVGFREAMPASCDPGDYVMMDESADVLYVHDDNIGPNVRCVISMVNGAGPAIITTRPPDYAPSGCSFPETPVSFLPETLLIAVHEELRISSDDFFADGYALTRDIRNLIVDTYQNAGLSPVPSFLFSTRFLCIRDYLHSELERHFGEGSVILGRVRLDILEKAPPMSLHIGLLRISLNDNPASLLLDVIYDTTDSDRNRPVLAHLVYDKGFATILSALPTDMVHHFLGSQIIAY